MQSQTEIRIDSLINTRFGASNIKLTVYQLFFSFYICFFLVHLEILRRGPVETASPWASHPSRDISVHGDGPGQVGILNERNMYGKNSGEEGYMDGGCIF
jgi:hypothetical protein